MDFYKVKCSEVRPFFGQTLPNGFNPNADIILITESGYLMMVKSFTDDLAWMVQRQLVNVYFSHPRTKWQESACKVQGDYVMNALLTRKEAAQKLGISVATLDAERSCGRLTYIQRKPGGKVWITEEALAEYLARATHPARPEMKSFRAGHRKWA